jgi:hypothetical protein
LGDWGSAVNFAATSNIGYSERSVASSISVGNPIITEANSPASTIRQFLASGRAGIVGEAFNPGLSNLKLLSWQSGQLFLCSRQDEKGVTHFRERLISATAVQKGRGFRQTPWPRHKRGCLQGLPALREAFHTPRCRLRRLLFFPFFIGEELGWFFHSVTPREVYFTSLRPARAVNPGCRVEETLLFFAAVDFEDG